MLQCVAVCCSVLQCVAVICSEILSTSVCLLGSRWWRVRLRGSRVLQCVVAVRYSVLQYVAVCCSVLQCVPAWLKMVEGAVERPTHNT